MQRAVRRICSPLWEEEEEEKEEEEKEEKEEKEKKAAAAHVRYWRVSNLSEAGCYSSPIAVHTREHLRSVCRKYCSGGRRCDHLPYTYMPCCLSSTSVVSNSYYDCNMTGECTYLLDEDGSRLFLYHAEVVYKVINVNIYYFM